MFFDYYKLREQPFGVTPNPRYLYHSPAHREALASLIYGIEADLGFSALIAEPGMGKTTLLFYLLEKFRDTARTALVFQTNCSSLELLRYLASEFELPSDEDDPVVLNERIRDLLVKEARAGRRVILIIDEAQNLSEDVLESVRLLSDFETPDLKLMHIILAGQQQLAEKLARRSLAQLLQRIAMLNRLNPLTPEETKNYIEYRLRVAGYRGAPLFTQDAINAVARLSGGVPRKINRICFNALSLGCAVNKRVIDCEIIDEVGADLDIGELLYQRGAMSPSPEPQGTIVRSITSPAPSGSTSVDPATEERPWSASPAAIEARPVTAPPIAARPIASPQSVQPETWRPSTATTGTTVLPSAGPAVAGVSPAKAATPATSFRKPAIETVLIPEVKSAPKPSPTTRVAVRVKPHVGAAPIPASRSGKLRILAGVLGAVMLLAGWGLLKMAHQDTVQPAPQPETTQESTLPEKSVELPPLQETAKRAGSTSQKGKSADKKSSESPEVKPDDSAEPADGTKISAPPQQYQTETNPSQRDLARDNSTVVNFGSNNPPEMSPGRSSRGVTPASLLRRVQPTYPAAAQQAGVDGTVVVAAVIGRDGRTKNVRAVSGNALLAQAAVDAVRKWIYRPYLLDGQPTDVDTRVVINFDLSAASQ